MKKLVSLFVLTVILSVAFTGVAFAATHGPHDLGPEFGKAVSVVASTDPAILVAHVSGYSIEVETESMGMPAAHKMTGAEFGAAVSQMDPGALADHVSSYAQGMPALHKLSGYAFGQLVRINAPISDHFRR